MHGATVKIFGTNFHMNGYGSLWHFFMADFIMEVFSGELVKLTLIYIRNFFSELRFICWGIFHFIKLCKFTMCPWHTHTHSQGPCFRDICQWGTCHWSSTGNSKKWTYLPNKKLKKKLKSALQFNTPSKAKQFLVSAKHNSVFYHIILFRQHVSAKWPSSGHL